MRSASCATTGSGAGTGFGGVEVAQIRLERTLVVAAHQALERGHVARAHRLEDLAVLFLGLLDAVGEHALEVEAAQAIPAIERLRGEVLHHVEAGQLADRQVEAAVQRRPLLAIVGRERGLHRVDLAAEQREVGGASPFGDEARRRHLEAFEDDEHVDDRIARHRRHRGADVRHDLDERFGLQQLQRLAHRDDRDVEAPRQVVDDQTLTRLQLAPEDRVTQGPVDELLLGSVRGGGQGAKRHAFLGVHV